MSRKHRLTHTLLVSVAACAGGAGPTSPGMEVEDGGLAWDQGGEDTPEYSLARLLIADGDAPRVTVFDLDSEAIVGSLPIAASALFSGASGRYAYAHQGGEGLLRVVDPGQWLLSHVDHFHIVESELRLRAEQARVLDLSSVSAHEGWITAVDSQAGVVSSFQERSITAMSFMPSIAPIVPHRGVALVSHAHLVASDRASDGTWGISVRDALLPDVLEQFVGGCSAPTSIVGDAGRVLVACAEGLLALQWTSEGSEVTASWLHATAGDARPTRVRIHEPTGAVLFDRGALTLALARAEGISEISFDAPVLQFELRRQGTAAVVLTRDGRLHEVMFPSMVLGRTLDVTAAYDGDPARAPRFTLSHAYAYFVDARSPEVQAIRLASWQLEGRFPIGGTPMGIALAGMPSNYTDDRE